MRVPHVEVVHEVRSRVAPAGHRPGDALDAVRGERGDEADGGGAAYLRKRLGASPSSASSDEGDCLGPFWMPWLTKGGGAVGPCAR